MDRYKFGKRIDKSILLLVVILVAQIILVVIAGIQKKGYFVDEMWTYGLANSYYHPHLNSDGAFDGDEYLSPDYFRDYLEVSSEDAFCYGSVFYNQSQDSHPPLYYCVMHTICSIFQNTFSKWFGIIPNICYFVICGIIIYLLSKSVLTNKYIALLPVALWGFSTQTVSYTIFIRMYMMFTMFVVLDMLLHKPCLSDGKCWGLKKYVFLFLVNLGGFLTQYYYYIFAFFLSGITVLMLLSKKQWKQFFSYSGVMLTSVISAVLVFPGIIKTFTDARGAEAINNLTSSRSWLGSLKDYVGNINDKVLYGWNKWLFAFALFGFVLLIIFGVLNNFNVTLGQLLQSCDWLLPVMATVAFFYMVIIIKISPFSVDRYYYPLMPFVWILAVYCIYKGFGNLKYGLCISTSLVLITSFLAIKQGYDENKIMYQYKGQENNMEALMDFKNASCIYIINGRWYTTLAHTLEFQLFSEIKVIDVSSKDLMETEVHDQYPYMIVYVDDALNQEEILSQIFQKTGYTQYLEIGRGSGVWCDDIPDIYIYAFR